MQIFYISYTRFPSEKAHAIYLAKVIESFNDVSGVSATAVVPTRFDVSKSSAKEYYSLKSDIPVKRLWSVDLQKVKFFRLFFYYIGIFSFAVSTFFFCFSMSKKEAILMSNDALVVLLLIFCNKPVAYELHDYPQKKNFLYRFIFNKVNLIHTNNQQKKSRLIKNFEINQDKIFVQHNGVTVADFNITETKIKARQKLELESDKKIVVYTGSLLDWKGADVLAEAMKDKPEYITLFIGGIAEEVNKMKETYGRYEHIQFLGQKSYELMPLYQRAADVLVVPNTAKKDISNFHTSPMKIFEYMASGTPIVASDIPSIGEILSDRTAVLFAPDDPGSLVTAIERVINSGTTEMTKAAFTEVVQYDWQIRAYRYISVLKKMSA